MDTRKEQVLREVRTMTTEDLGARIEELARLREVAHRRACVADSEVVGVLLDELQIRLEAVQKAYRNVNSKDFPNVVAVSLSRLQGQEEEICTQIRIWKDAKNSKKVIDEELSVCNDVIIERRKSTTL
jgi:hypothetical protein